MPTTYDKATLATYFEQLDVPQGTDYANLIYSQVNIAQSTEQTMIGALNTPELVTARLSAGNVNVVSTLNVGGTTSADNIYCNNVITSAIFAGSMVITNLSASNVSAGTLYADNIFASTARFNGTVSAASIYVNTGLFQKTVIISAAGTTQATGTPASAIICQIKGVTDGSNTGVLLQANNQGLTQYIYNDIASANLWPCVGGRINALASNAAFGMAASTLYTVVHIEASGYAVK